MAVFAVDRALLRDVLLPELTLAPGRGVMARVVAAQGGRGTLSIAGYLLEAELPLELRAGQELRLEVRDLDEHRVLLGIADHPDGATEEPAAPPPQTPPQTPLPASPPVTLPGGATVRAVADEDERTAGAQGAATGRHTLALSYEGPQLGTVELRLELDPGALRVAVVLSPGDPLHRGAASADALREALADAVARTVSVTVTPRRRPLDLYA